MKRIKQYRILACRIDQNDSWEKMLKERVLGTLNGTNAYVYRKLVDNMKIELENLRAKIYHQCPAEQKKMPFIIECKNVYTNSKSDEKI